MPIKSKNIAYKIKFCQKKLIFAKKKTKIINFAKMNRLYKISFSRKIFFKLKHSIFTTKKTKKIYLPKKIQKKNLTIVAQKSQKTSILSEKNNFPLKNDFSEKKTSIFAENNEKNLKKTRKKNQFSFKKNYFSEKKTKQKLRFWLKITKKSMFSKKKSF